MDQDQGTCLIRQVRVDDALVIKGLEGLLEAGMVLLEWLMLLIGKSQTQTTALQRMCLMVRMNSSVVLPVLVCEWNA
jgi:hypothetical protein